MIKDDLHTYYFKIKTLNPIHIGTGEIYEPTNFVIDNGTFYQFDEILFYQSLNQIDKGLFNIKLNNWINLIDFYRSKVKEAKNIAKFECNVTNKVEQTYKKIKNNDGTTKQNQFQISQTLKNPNTYRAIIPGSSLKGMFDTIFKIYPQKIKENKIRQRLIVSDAILLDGKTQIGYAYRRHKNPNRVAKSEIPQILEIITKDSTFILSMTTEYSFKQIQKKMEDYYKDREDSKYTQTKDSFIARVGKFCGKEYMIDDINNAINSYGNPIATHTLYENDENFGWIEFKKIDKQEFDNLLKIISDKEKEYYKKIKEKQKDIKAKIILQKQKAKEEALRKQKEKEQEEKKRAEEEAVKKAKLEQMTPFEREIYKLKENNSNPKESIDIIIYKAIKENRFEDFRCEALRRLKEEMIKLKKWIEHSKKPNKDKKYKRTQEVIKMLRDCK